MKNITLLGSTGSIGMQTLDVIREHPELYKVRSLACGRNTGRLSEQIREFTPGAVSLRDGDAAEKIRQEFPDLDVFTGHEGLERLAADRGTDIVLNAVVGMAGMMPTYRAVCAGNTVALANKESLVAGGELIMKTAADRGVSILPVDSEHSAVFQSMQGSDRKSVRRIILTASSGPFRGKTRKELENVTVKQALRNPNWDMGAKVTIDSSTLMNKGFEVAEARWLFDMDPDRIDVLVHPESIVHSMVEYSDRAVIAQLGVPDMRVPISYALSYPERIETGLVDTLDLVKTGRLTFEKPDTDTFECLDIAFDALRAGGTYCTAVNAADELLVKAFIDEKIGFLDIQEILKRVMDAHVSRDAADPDDIFQADADARKLTGELISDL